MVNYFVFREFCGLGDKFEVILEVIRDLDIRSISRN